jgi:C-terminal processing protease CtpA/Prc
VYRKNGEMFGFTLSGQKPITVEAVDKNSPCDFANIYPNDVILSVDGISLDDKSQAFLSELLKTSGNQTNFEIIQMSEYEPYMKTKKSNNKRSNRSESFHKAINSPINNDFMDLKNSEGKTFKENVRT